MAIERYEAKSLVRQGHPSLFSWADVYLNPYQGCSHDCRYCYGKSEGYYMHEDFAGWTRVKTNAPELLRQYLKRKGFAASGTMRQKGLFDTGEQPPKFTLGIGGGVCEVYQPAEAELGITRSLLEIAADYRFQVALLTKNVGVLRDLDLLERINRISHAACSFTITLASDRQQRTSNGAGVQRRKLSPGALSLAQAARANQCASRPVLEGRRFPGRFKCARIQLDEATGVCLASRR